MTGLEVTDEMVERGARALSKATPLILDGYESSIYSEEIKAHWRAKAESYARQVIEAALQACEAGGSPSSPKQTSELEEAEGNKTCTHS